jgi:hypothetical protein
VSAGRGGDEKSYALRSTIRPTPGWTLLVGAGCRAGLVPLSLLDDGSLPESDDCCWGGGDEACTADSGVVALTLEICIESLAPAKSLVGCLSETQADERGLKEFTQN